MDSCIRLARTILNRDNLSSLLCLTVFGGEEKVFFNFANRKELVSFDESRKTVKVASPTTEESPDTKKCVVATKCYGCASASVEHCLTLLRALATKPTSRVRLFQQGLIEELMEFNLRRGSNSVRHEVRKLVSTSSNFLLLLAEVVDK